MSDPHPDRHGLCMVFDSVEKVADRREDALLLMCLTALRQVHALYPEADELRLRGTPEHRARVDVHNAIVAVVNEYLSAVNLDEPDGEMPQPETTTG